MVKPKTLTAAAYDGIRQLVLDGEIPRGEKVNLEDVASRLEVSMTPVREALTKLQQEGLVEYTPRAGWRVARLSRDKYFKYRELQLLLELTLTDRAFPYVTDDAIKVMEEANERLRSYLEMPQSNTYGRAILKENDTIHMALFSCYANEVMTRTLQNIWDSMCYYRIALFNTEYYREIGCKQHMEIIKALKQRNVLAVRYAMERHLAEGPQCLESVFDD